MSLALAAVLRESAQSSGRSHTLESTHLRVQASVLPEAPVLGEEGQRGRKNTRRALLRLARREWPHGDDPPLQRSQQRRYSARATQRCPASGGRGPVRTCTRDPALMQPRRLTQQPGPGPAGAPDHRAEHPSGMLPPQQPQPRGPRDVEEENAGVRVVISRVWSIAGMLRPPVPAVETPYELPRLPRHWEPAETAVCQHPAAG